MSQVLQDVPEKVKKSVLSGTIIVNSILLLFHISFGTLFYLYKAPIMIFQGVSFRYLCSLWRATAMSLR